MTVARRLRYSHARIASNGPISRLPNATLLDYFGMIYFGMILHGRGDDDFLDYGGRSWPVNRDGWNLRDILTDRCFFRVDRVSVDCVSNHAQTTVSCATDRGSQNRDGSGAATDFVQVNTVQVNSALPDATNVYPQTETWKNPGSRSRG